MAGLSVSDLVQVTVNLSIPGANGLSFGQLCIAGDSNVINGLQRLQTFGSLTQVGLFFGTGTPEYQAAQFYFSQSPTPETLMIGRWISSATQALNDGGILSASQQLLSNWTSITNGGFVISINGVVQTLTGLNFSGATNLNGVASIITTALGSSGTCTWNGTNFVIASATSGTVISKATGSVTFTGIPNTGVAAVGTITFSGQPGSGDTLTVIGTAIAYVTSGAGPGQINIGVSQAATVAATLAFLQASVDTNISKANYSASGSVITCTSKVSGTAGNAYTLAKSSANMAVTATFSGGAAGDTLTMNGVVLTFVSSGSGMDLIPVGGTAALTAAALQAYLVASSEAGLTVANYSTTGAVTTVTYATSGAGGNAYTLVKNSSVITLSGATLSGGGVSSPSVVGYATAGSGTDISGQLQLTSSLSQALIPSYNAETPAACAAVLANLSASWYGLMFAAGTQPTDSQSIAVSAFIEATGSGIARVYGVTTQETAALSSLSTTDLASLMQAAAYNRSFVQYSSTSPYACASFFGRAFTVNFEGSDTTINLMWKQEPGVVAEQLTEQQALVLKSKNCNVFVAYVNATTIIQYGNMSSGQFFDTIQGVDWLQNAVQTACFNLIYTSSTKIPQTDAGVNQLTNAIAGVMQQGVNNGLIAPGLWNASGFGGLKRGQFLTLGYYIYAQPLFLQSESDRASRVAPPIQVAVKLAGAIQTVNIIINVNQ